MTTIAYRDGILAADTQLTDSGIKMLCRKIDIWEDGTVIASAGNDSDQLVLKELLTGASKKKRAELAKGFEAIIIDPDGKPYRLGRDCVKVPIDAGTFYACGSGFTVALAGMCVGLSSEAAVKLAGEIQVDTNTIVDTYNVKTKKLTLARFPKYGKG